MKKMSDRIVSGDAAAEDADMLESVAYQIDGKTICAFGEVAQGLPKALSPSFATN